MSPLLELVAVHKAFFHQMSRRFSEGSICRLLQEKAWH